MGFFFFGAPQIWLLVTASDKQFLQVETSHEFRFSVKSHTQQNKTNLKQTLVKNARNHFIKHLVSDK